MMYFDEANLIVHLNQLSVNAKTAFATACASRLIRSTYVACLQNYMEVDRAIDFMWNQAADGFPKDHELMSYIDRLLAMLPEEDDTWVPECLYVEDGLSALVYAFRTRLTGESQEAAWSARVVYEALDNHVIQNRSIDISIRDNEALVIADPTIQLELSRQLRDLAELEGAKESETVAIQQVRDRSRSELALPLEKD